MHDGKKVDLKNVSALAGLKDIRFDDSFCMAVAFLCLQQPTGERKRQVDL